MADMHKTYLLAPSWGLKPSEVALGNAIASVKLPQRLLSNKNLPNDIDTEIRTEEAKDCSGKVKTGNTWSVGLFATFVHFITAGFETSYSSTTSLEIEYSCESMETLMFTISPEFLAKVAADTAVKTHLKLGGMGAKVFVITGIKIAKGITITTTEENKSNAAILVGADIPLAQTTVGPKATLNPSNYQTHTKTIDGPIVFAFQVEKLRVSRKGEATSSSYVVGAMLGERNDEDEFVIEISKQSLDDDDMDDFGVKPCEGLEESGERCQIFIPTY
ncbi:hypothetical protein MKX08_003311 [Trichoderma sp. CBMAI-0020]|nr:hypothetical protein MKX08_003311 [Trichoderma sp. CBMAI-0020]